MKHSRRGACPGAGGESLLERFRFLSSRRLGGSKRVFTRGVVRSHRAGDVGGPRGVHERRGGRGELGSEPRQRLASRLQRRLDVSIVVLFILPFSPRSSAARVASAAPRASTPSPAAFLSASPGAS